MNSVGKQWVSGKIGEWLQGTDKSGDPIVFPLATTSSPFRTVTWIEPAANLSIIVGPRSPGSKRKTKLAVNTMAVACGFATECDYRITVWDSPPRAKGLGSSSIDIASALLSIKHYRNLDVSDAALFQVMCRVERSDFLFSPESIVATNPVAGSFSIGGRVPSCIVLAWDTAPLERIDTEVVRHLDLARRRFGQEYEELCSLIQTGNMEAMFYASTRSAEINDRLLPKPGFSTARRLVNDFPTLGLVAAHTGTFLGLVFPSPADTELLTHLRAKVIKEFSVEPLLFRVGA
jgi:L-threonine kinase